MKQTTGAQGAWAGKEETTAHLTQKELDCPGARITQHVRAKHDRQEAGSTEAHPGDEYQCGIRSQREVSEAAGTLDGS